MPRHRRTEEDMSLNELSDMNMSDEYSDQAMSRFEKSTDKRGLSEHRLKSVYANYSAHTTHPNTPESDLEPTVKHTVSFTVDGKPMSIEIQAKCPMDAIQKAKRFHGVR